jgi:hypothetical protein
VTSEISLSGMIAETVVLIGGVVVVVNRFTHSLDIASAVAFCGPGTFCCPNQI